MMRDIRKRGFTLIEIVIVVAIVALLAGLITPFVFRYLDEASETATLEEMKNIRDAIIGVPTKTGDLLNSYRRDMNEFPPMWVTDGKEVYSGLITLNRITTGYGQLFACEKDGSIFPYSGPIAAATGGSVTGWRGPYILEASSTYELLNDSWENEYYYIIDPYEYDVAEISEGHGVSV